MNFGQPLPDDRWFALVRRAFERGVRIFITADVYGCGGADDLLARALSCLPRADNSLVGAVGHDFYKGQRQGSRGYPRFTDPALRSPIEAKVDGLASLANVLPSAEEVDLMARLGNNRGCMSLQGANRSHTTTAEPDRWSLSADLEAVGINWGIDPEADLGCSHSD
jgi:hypothetical protein